MRPAPTDRRRPVPGRLPRGGPGRRRRDPERKGGARAVRGLLLALACLGALAAWAAPPGRAQDVAPARREVEVFVQERCPHCAHAKAWLERLARERGDLDVRVSSLAEPDARERLRALAQATGTAVVAAPALRVGDRLVVGWGGEETTGRLVLDLLEGRGADAAPGEPASCPIDLEPEAPPCAEPDANVVEVPFLGRLAARDVGLPLFTVVLGLVDGFNPCAMWVLVFLLSVLVHLKSRSRMLAIAGTFVLVSGLVYFAFMAAWLNFFLVVGFARWIQVVLGLLAVAVGAVHVKDFFALHRGLTLSIPEAAKPALYDRVRRILTAQDMTGAMVSVVALALMVNTVELLCTAGLPAVYTRVLTQQGLSAPAHYAYLALYQVFYMLDDALMLLVAVVTLSRRRLQERSGRWLKLVSGVVIAALGLTLLLRPEWLYW